VWQIIVVDKIGDYRYYVFVRNQIFQPALVDGSE